MPTSSASDDTPAWIKGDLPAETPESDTKALPAEASGSRKGAEAGGASQPAEPEAGIGERDEDGVRGQSERKAEDELDGIDEPSVASTDDPIADLETAVSREPSITTAPAVAELPDVAGKTDLLQGPPVVDRAELDAKPESASASEVTWAGTPAPEPLQPGSNGAETTTISLDNGQPARAKKVEPPAPELPVVERLSLEALIESLLFVADGAIPIARLAEALEVSNREVEAALTTLTESYRQRGLSLQRFRDKVQLTTSPSAAARVERFLGLAAATPLSRAALEALAIVAYQQPVTRPQIEAVRGVNSDSVIKNLLTKGLIEESGRAEGPGRPVLYTTTSEFMQHFGLAALSDLPPLSPPDAGGAANPEGILKG